MIIGIYEFHITRPLLTFQALIMGHAPTIWYSYGWLSCRAARVGMHAYKLYLSHLKLQLYS